MLNGDGEVASTGAKPSSIADAKLTIPHVQVCLREKMLVVFGHQPAGFLVSVDYG
jgi:hypothetical protein